MAASLRHSYRSRSCGNGRAVCVTTALLVALAVLLAISTVTADTRTATAETLESRDVSALASSTAHHTSSHSSSSGSASVTANVSASSSASFSQHTSSSSSTSHSNASSTTTSHASSSSFHNDGSSSSSSKNATESHASSSSVSNANSRSSSSSSSSKNTTAAASSSNAHASHSSQSSSKSAASTTSPTTTTTTKAPTSSPTKAPTSSKKPSDGDNDSDAGDGGLPMVIVLLLIFFFIGVVLYGSRAFPKTCPFFRGGGGAGGAGRGAAPQTQQYARLDGGAFYGDDEDYRGMEPSFAAANTAGRPGLSGQHARGHSGGSNARGDLIVEMQEKLKAEPPMGKAESTPHAPLPPSPLQQQQQHRESAVPSAMAGVVDHNPAALDALFGAHSSSGAATPAPAASPAPIPLHSKNSLKSLRKGKLGPASAVTPFGLTRSAGEDDGSSGGGISGGLQMRRTGSGSQTSGPRPRDNWGWSDDEEDK